MSTEIAGLPVAGEPESLMTPLAADTDLYDAIGMHEGAAFRYKNRLVQ